MKERKKNFVKVQHKRPSNNGPLCCCRCCCQKDVNLVTEQHTTPTVVEHCAHSSRFKVVVVDGRGMSCRTNNHLPVAAMMKARK